MLLLWHVQVQDTLSRLYHAAFLPSALAVICDSAASGSCGHCCAANLPHIFVIHDGQYTHMQCLEIAAAAAAAAAESATLQSCSQQLMLETH
jgi:hypothetical protein